MRSSLLMLGMLVAVSGCATQAQRKLTGIQQDVKKSEAEVKACFAAVRAKPEYAAFVARKMPESRPSLTQLADDSIISESDRALYIAFVQDGQPCRDMSLAEAGRISPAMYNAASTGQSNADKIRLALVQRKITWGQFYQSIMDNQAATRTASRSADQELMGELKAEHQDEMNRRASVAAAFAAASQQMQENQQRQQMINAINRPVNTTCNRMGDQTNCTSY